VLSLKDNNQSANLEALIDAGIRSFKIEGRYKDMGYVKNITAHYRTLLDDILERRPEFARASSGRTTFAFTPTPTRTSTANSPTTSSRPQDDIGAFDTPKNPGLPIGYVQQGRAGLGRLQTDSPPSCSTTATACATTTLQKELPGWPIKPRREGGEGVWRVFPKDPMAS
jgi:23S rRNA 5-hydroxycytidine C2501 synthase